MIIGNKNEYSSVAAAVKAVIRRIVPLTPRMLANSIRMLKSADSFVRTPDVNTLEGDRISVVPPTVRLSKIPSGDDYPVARFGDLCFISPLYSILTWYCCSFAEQMSLLSAPSVEVTRRHSLSS